MKCDETRPACNRCVRAKRTCDGYLSETAPLSRRDLAVVVRQLQIVGPAARVLGGPQPAEDPACFDFFRTRTADMTGTFFPSDFWSRLVLQAAHAEPAIWRVAVALGAMHRFGEGASQRQDAAHFKQFALGHYAQAMAMAREIREPQMLLISSVAFAALANMAGRFADSQVHVKAGLRAPQRRLQSGGRKGGHCPKCRALHRRWRAWTCRI